MSRLAIKRLMLAAVAFEAVKPLILGNPVDAQHQDEGVLVTDEQATISFPRELLLKHMLIMGMTGSGKTVDALEKMEFLVDLDIGFTLVDLKGDTGKQFAIRMMRRYQETGDIKYLDRFNFLKLAADWIFRLGDEEFDDSDLPEDCRELAQEAFKITNADRRIRSTLRHYAEADRAVMVRLQRFMRDVEVATSTRLESGARLSRADWEIFLNVHHEHHLQVMKKVSPFLTDQVRSDLRRLSEIEKDYQRDQYTESTSNQYRRVMTPLVESLYADPYGPSLNFDQMVQNSEWSVAVLNENRLASAEATLSVADTIIQGVRNALASQENRGTRTPHVLILEEAGMLVADDLPRFLDTLRGYGGAVWLIGQSIKTFQLGDIDMMEDLQGQVSTFISGQQKGLKTLEALSPYFTQPNRNLNERFDIVDRPDPDSDEIIELRARSSGGSITISKGKTKTRSDAAGEAVSVNRSQSKGETRMKMFSWTRSLMNSWNKGRGKGKSSGSGIGDAVSAGESPMMIDGNMIMIPTASQGTNHSSHDGTSEFESEGEGGGEGEAKTNGSAISEMLSNVFGLSVSRHKVQANSEGDSITFGKGISWNEVISEQLVQRTKEELRPTGQPEYALDFQHARFEKLLSILPPRYMMMRARIDGRDQTVMYRTRFVADIDRDPAGDYEDLQRFLVSDLFPTKPYMYRPVSTREARRRRLARFLDVEPGNLDGSQDVVTQDPNSPFSA